MNHPLKVRTALPSDAEVIARIHTHSWQHAYRGIFPDDYLTGLQWQPRKNFWQGELTSPPDGQSVLLAEQDNTVVGFVAVGYARDDDLPDHSSEIYAIYVAPSAWSTGAGSALLNKAVETLTDLPAAPDLITLWVLKDNRRARSFYERNNFQPDGSSQQVERGQVTVVEIRYRRILHDISGVQR
jgi:ribosomal protein S18 acetylase RimI-like enzyme